MKLSNLLFLLMPSCVGLKSPDGTTFVMLGTNATTVSVGNLSITNVNQTEAIDKAGKVILQSALISAGAEVIKTGVDEGAKIINSAVNN